MAAARVSAPTVLPLEKALELKDFQKSSDLYNTLLDDHDQPTVADSIIADLASMFVRHNAHKGTILVGTTFDDATIRWAKPVPIDGLDRSTVHGHVFVFTENGLCPYELEEGVLPDLSWVDEEFLANFMSYLTLHNLTGLLGLQVLGCGGSDMIELILDEGTVMLESSLAKSVHPTRVTGWKFESVNGRPRTCEANETHSTMTSGNHKVFNAGKPLPKLENVEDLKNALVEAGIL